MKSSAPTHAQCRGFTLIELLVVIAIIVMLVGLVVPAMRGVGAANQLTNAGSMVISELNVARQIALSESQAIEVRFFKVPDATGQNPEFRALQRIRAADGAPLDNLVRLPTPIFMSSLDKFSTILSPLNGGLPAKTQTVQDIANVEYRSVRFDSSGRTNLDPLGANNGNDRWFLTLANQNEIHSANATSAKPAHTFLTVQVEPITGRTRIYRP